MSQSLNTAEILAACDPKSFRFLLEGVGFQVTARREHDPLMQQVTLEDVSSIAATINEDTDDTGYDPYLDGLRNIAHDYGYIIQPR